MGIYTGRKSAGKIFAVLYQYFSTVPQGFVFTANQIYPILLEMYNDKFPMTPVNNTTLFSDGLRTLSKEEKCLEVLARGKYRLIKKITAKDERYFRRMYPKVKSPNKSVKKQQMKKQDQPENLKSLGSAKTTYVYDTPDHTFLETFPNQFPDRDYTTEFIFLEFSSLCPKTGQPDFAKITVRYIPDKLCIETKSLKLYFLSYRQHGSFMETIVNNILNDCVSVCAPRYMEIVGNFNARGGTLINVIAKYTKE